MIYSPRLLVVFYCALAAVSVGNPVLSYGQESSSSSKSAEKKNLFKDYTAAEFKKLEKAQQKIDAKDFNEDLLAAAIFHETNAVRAGHGLSRLDYHPEVAKAAEKHAKKMAKGNFLGHGTPNQPENTTPYERIKKEGLNPRFSAENVAFNFLLKYESGKPFYTREEDGRTVYSYKPDGEPLQRHTYVGFAEVILKQWMNSPGHRKNIMATEPTSLGVGCALSKDEKGFDKVYCNQNFFAPLPDTPL